MTTYTWNDLIEFVLNSKNNHEIGLIKCPRPWPSQDLISRVTMFHRSLLLLVLVHKIVKRKVTCIFIYIKKLLWTFFFCFVLKRVKVYCELSCGSHVIVIEILRLRFYRWFFKRNLSQYMCTIWICLKNSRCLTKLR